MKIIDYKIIKKSSCKLLIEEIMKEIENGYQPIGGCSFNNYENKNKIPSRGEIYIQAVVKYEEENKN